MKRFVFALVAGLAFAAACLPGKSFAFTYTPYQAGDSFTLFGAIDGTGIVNTYTVLPIDLAAPTQLVDFHLQDDQYNGIPELTFELSVLDCTSGSCIHPSLYSSPTAIVSFTAPNILLNPGKYMLQAYVTLLTAPGVERFDGFTFSGSFAAAPIATTPIPAAMLMFGTGLGSLGGLRWLRRRRRSADA